MSQVTNTYTPPQNKVTVVANYSALPDPTTVSGKFYWAEASQGTSWLPGSLGGTYYNSGMYYSNGVSWSFVNVPYQATQSEVNTGINTDKFVTPNTLSNSVWAFTATRVLSTVLSGLSASSGTFTASSTILEAFGKIKFLIDNIATSSVAGIVKLYTSTGSNTDGTMDQNSITNALGQRIRYWGSAIDGASVANTLTITPTYSQLIPANTFSAGDVVDLECRLTSPGAKTSVSNLYFYVNTSNSVSGATQLAIYASAATNRTIQNQRKLSIKGATTKSINPAASTINTDLGASAAMTTHTIDWTVDQWLIFAIGHTVADQTMFGDFYTIQKK